MGRGRDDDWGLSQRRAFAQGLLELAYGRSAGDYGRSAGDYGRFENDDQGIRSHGGRFKSRDDDDQRYGMGLQGGAGRGRWAEDPRQDEEPGVWDRQVWAEDDRYRTRGARDLEILHTARGDDRWAARAAGEEERLLRTEEAEPWPGHGRSEEDVRREMRPRPVGWRPGR